MSSTRIDEIRARLAAATPGPWNWVGRHLESDALTILVDDTLSDFAEAVRPGDAALIAAAPDDIAHLLAEVERLQADSKVQRVVEERATTLALQGQVDRLRAALEWVHTRLASDYKGPAWAIGDAREVMSRALALQPSDDAREAE